MSAASTTPLWGCWEATWQAAATLPSDREIAVRLKAPSGRERLRSAFWDGGTTWRVRFAPDEVGEWRYAVDGAGLAPGLDGVTGGFTVSRAAGVDPGAPADRFRAHGPIRVAGNGRYLEHQDGTPFFWLGDTAWDGPLLARVDEWDTYLADRARKHFTTIQYVPTAPWRTAYADGQGHIAFSGHEHLTLHPEFFRRMDRRVEAIAAAGFLSAIVLLWAIRGAENPGYSLPEDQAIRLARYLTARYGAYPTAWLLAGDGDYTGDAVGRWQRIGRGVFPDTDRAPVTLHAGGMRWPFEEFRREPWFDFLGYQSGHGDDDRTLAWMQTGPPAENWKWEPIRPVLNLEPPYEDHISYQSRQRHSAYSARRAAYWSLLSSPTAGLTYGGHGIWSWQIEAGLPLNHPSTGEARPWHEAIHLPGSTHMAHLARLFTSLPWWTLEPDPALPAVQPGTDAPARTIGAARSGDGRTAVLYLPQGGSVTLAAERVPAESAARWFNPRTGEGEETPAAGAGRTYSAPDQDDWVLVLTADR